MKKIITTLLFAAAAVSLHAAQTLYWMVDLEDRSAENEFAYAMISSGGEILANTTVSGGSGGGELVAADASGYSTQALYADVTSYVGSTFLFELLNDEYATIGSKTVSYNDLMSGGHIFTTGDSMSKVTPYVLTSVVPEPTSGLLLLFGLAGLALRRRTRG